MTQNSTARVRAYRQRQRDVQILLPRFAIDFELADALKDYGLLQDWDINTSDEGHAIAAAIVRLLQLLSARADTPEAQAVVEAIAKLRLFSRNAVSSSD